MHRLTVGAQPGSTTPGGVTLTPHSLVMMMLQALATRPAPGCAGRSLKRGGADHARPLRQQPARLAWRAAVVAPPPRCLQRVQAVRADEEANEEQPQRKYSLEGLQG